MTDSPSEFEKAAAEKDPGLIRDFIGFMGSHKKWWLAPILLVILLFGLLVLVGGSGAAPFVYTLF
jgi:hypothetical protein